MPDLAPDLAAVRPRVRDDLAESSRLLEELVAEYADERSNSVLWLVGEKGAGKTTALAHLAAVFIGDDRFAFIDDADELAEEVVLQNYRKLEQEVLVVAARTDALRSATQSQLRLEPWGVDEFLEYLLPRHRQECGGVMQRLGGSANGAWMPQTARIVVDQLLENPELPDVESALLAYVRQRLPSTSMMSAARQYCLALQTGGRLALLKVPQLLNILPADVCKVLRHPSVQSRIAAEQVVAELSSWRPKRPLELRMPRLLVQAVGRLCRTDELLKQRIDKILDTVRNFRSHAMAASILLAADPAWRPEFQRNYKDFSGAHFAEAQWNGICLAGLSLQLADLSGAQLMGASLDQSIIVEADFIAANLVNASLEKTLANGAVFDGANLHGANLTNIVLESASLVDADLRSCELHSANLRCADLTGAILCRANLSEAKFAGAILDNIDMSGCNLTGADARRIDFRTAQLVGANMERAWLNGANLEDVVWPGATLTKAGLRGAHMTGSRMNSGNLCEADLSGAGLGEVDWEDADLRKANLSGATFHMGSSRSGLVDSPIASEGSRTGFYTDELEDLYFKTPEEVRKANLRGADLRGASIEHVDFYLVDLRDAKLDLSQFRQARATGAILSE